MQHDRAPRRPLASRAVPTAVVILAVVGLAPSVAAQATPEPDGTIAFIEDRVRIHTIRADGSDDRVVFGLTPEATSGIQGVAWRPDGQRLAFASGHEELCSIWLSDVYLMDRDGTDLTRLTNGPACADIGGLPTGTVRVTVANTLTEPAQILLHAQGLEMAQAAEVAPGTRSTFVLPVHDLGPDSPQFVVASDGGSTWFDPAFFADVRAGETTDVFNITIGTDVFDALGALSVSWSFDGTRLAYQQGLGSLWQIPAAAGPLEIGTTLFDADASAPMSATTPTWSPTDDRILYQRYDTTPTTIDLGRADGDRAGDPILTATLVNGIDWLPDGSGFIASDSSAMVENANLVLADLRTGAVTPITGYESGFAIWPTVSPDGLFVAYSYSPVPLDEATALELHVRHLATGVDRVVVANALNPDWGP